MSFITTITKQNKRSTLRSEFVSKKSTPIAYDVPEMRLKLFRFWYECLVTADYYLHT